MDKPKTMGGRIRALREGLSMTVQDLSFESRIGVQNIYLYEQDERKPMDPNKLADLAAVLKTTTDYLIKGEEAVTCQCTP